MITAALNPLAHGPNPVAIPLAMRPFPAATSLPGIASPLTAIVTRWVAPHTAFASGVLFPFFPLVIPSEARDLLFPHPLPASSVTQPTTPSV
jgi:hypothetical protein